ncbi:hypothetical protein GCM10012275_24160 [Longimycelium tulufanense]|uniref:DUF2630 family protein n=1 Tax=Longimycelium tulufanense TaxID=907463 RepID=A0A8J3CCA0_9PSEU|nr:DUF2630 family protein [Longimycelium tulufanense]GGM52368.1 hypothetical protein GCM10012275_24160 [Longimycelium tulufanense]
MKDREVFVRIRELVDEEHRLREEIIGQGMSPSDNAQLRDLERALDQCWDLLRQRRARRESGRDPNSAHARRPSEVEGYSQ